MEYYFIKLIPKNRVNIGKISNTSCDKDVANKLNKHFTSIGNTLSSKFSSISTNTSNTKFNNITNNQFKFDIITPEYVF